MCVNTAMRRRVLTLLGSGLLVLWVLLGFARPWYGPPSHIARAEWSGSIEVQTWAPPWDRDIVDHVELFRRKRAGDVPELVTRAFYAKGVPHDGHFWLVFPDNKQSGAEFYLVATLRSGKLAPKQDITKVANEYSQLQFPYFAASIPLFLLGIALTVAGQCAAIPVPRQRVATEPSPGQNSLVSLPAEPEIQTPAESRHESST
jgi:hypothetical protein